MSLRSLTSRKIDLPHEPDAWVEVRPLSPKLMHTISLEAGRISREAMQADEFDTEAYGYAETNLILRESIVDWSYDAPVSPENIEDMDLETSGFLKMNILTGGAAEVPLPTTSPSSESSGETLTVE